MPSFPDSIFLFVLALLLFGPKRLPVLARELGKWVGEFRRASNEFKMQMEEELRSSEQADRQKQIAAMEAAAPVTAVIPEPEHPHLPAAVEEMGVVEPVEVAVETAPVEAVEEVVAQPAYEVVDGVRTPLPIAVSGELKIMPPETGLPAARSNGLRGLLDAIPAAEVPKDGGVVTESSAHGN
jgi:sec-independent protein translocase protein TatB